MPWSVFQSKTNCLDGWRLKADCRGVRGARQMSRGYGNGMRVRRGLCWGQRLTEQRDAALHCWEELKSETAMTLLPARMRSRGSPRSLLAGCEVEQTLPKAVWQFSYKTLIIRTSGHAPRYLPNELKTQPLRSTIYADRKKIHWLPRLNLSNQNGIHPSSFILHCSVNLFFKYGF